MTTLAESAQALWDLLDRDGFDANVVLILADCLEEQGSPDRLWEGLRAMVVNHLCPYRAPFYLSSNGGPIRFGWGESLTLQHPFFTKCTPPKDVYNLLTGNSPGFVFWRVYDTLSAAIKAYAQAWVSLNCD